MHKFAALIGIIFLIILWILLSREFGTNLKLKGDLITICDCEGAADLAACYASCSSAMNSSTEMSTPPGMMTSSEMMNAAGMMSSSDSSSSFDCVANPYSTECMMLNGSPYSSSSSSEGFAYPAEYFQMRSSAAPKFYENSTPTFVPTPAQEDCIQWPEAPGCGYVDMRDVPPPPPTYTCCETYTGFSCRKSCEQTNSPILSAKGKFDDMESCISVCGAENSASLVESSYTSEEGPPPPAQ